MCKFRRVISALTGVVLFLGLCGGCASMGKYGVECTGVVQYGCPSKQEVERRGGSLVVTNWEMDEVTGKLIKSTYLTEL